MALIETGELVKEPMGGSAETLKVDVEMRLPRMDGRFW